MTPATEMPHVCLAANSFTVLSEDGPGMLTSVIALCHDSGA
jgi:hypothetical protein